MALSAGHAPTARSGRGEGAPCTERQRKIVLEKMGSERPGRGQKGVQEAQAALSLRGSAWHRCHCRLKKEKEKVSFILNGPFSAICSCLPSGAAAGPLLFGF